MTAPALRPLEDIREDVVTAWQRNWRNEKAKEVAESIAGRVAAGEALAEVASDSNIVTITTEPFARDGRDLSVDVGPNFISAVFALEPGDSTEAVISGTGRYAIATLDEVLAAELDQADASLDELRGQLQRSVQGDVEIAFNDALRRKYGVQVNQALVDNLFDDGTAAP